MKTSWISALAVMLATVPVVRAQQQQLNPHIGYVYPAGGRQGTTFEVVIGGQNVNTVTNVFVSGTGIQAIVTEHNGAVAEGSQGTAREDG